MGIMRGAGINWILIRLLVVVTCLHSSVDAQKRQRIVEEPEDTRTVRGNTAILKCRVENQAGPVTWIKNGFALGSDRDLRAYDRYSMIGSGADGEYHLQIENVQLSDDAMYQCQLLQTAKSEGQISKTVRLTVLVAPNPPRLINFGDLITGAEGREFTIGCIAEKGKPPATVSWVISGNADGSNIIRILGNVSDGQDGTKKNKGVEDGKSKGEGSSDEKVVSTESPITDSVKNQMTKEDSLFTVRSYLKYTPLPRDDGKFLVCLVKHETVEGKMSAAAQLIVEYAPKVSVSLNTTGILREGGKGSLICEVDAKPSNNLKYTWKKDGNIQPRGQNSPVLLLGEGDLGRENQGSVYECEVANPIGTRSGKFTLEMEYGPLISTTKVVPVDRGKAVTLRCDVDSNPPARIEWRKKDGFQVLSTEENYTIASVQDWQEGAYLCTATAPGFPPVGETVTVIIKGPPLVFLPQSVEVAGDQMDTTIVCEVGGLPEASSIKWYKAITKEIEFANSRKHEQKLEKLADGELRSKLTIKRPTAADFDVYRCEAKNEKGKSHADTKLVSSDLIPLYVLIPGIIGACVAIMLMILCCILCNRKSCRSKTTTLSDDHSDVTVKVEAMDRSDMGSYPDMYGSGVPMENGAYYGKNYIPVRQDNPDMDMDEYPPLPPPSYSSYVQPPPSYGHSPSTFHPGMTNGNGHLVHMTYLDAEPNKNSNVYSEYLNSMNSHYYAPGNLMAQTHGMVVQPESAMYYPNGSMVAPLATLEPVYEVTTPEENSNSIQPDGGLELRNNSQGFPGSFQPGMGLAGSGASTPPGYTSVVVTSSGNSVPIQIPRIHSDGSTHV